jgi:hypothetical protein
VFDSTAVLVLVAVLPSSALAREPLNVEIAVPTLDKRGIFVKYSFGHDSNGDSRCMDATTPFGQWDTLNSMSTGLIAELLNAFSLNHKTYVVTPAGRRCLN